MLSSLILCPRACTTTTTGARPANAGPGGAAPGAPAPEPTARSPRHRKGVRGLPETVCAPAPSSRFFSSRTCMDCCNVYPHLLALSSHASSPVYTLILPSRYPFTYPCTTCAHSLTHSLTHSDSRSGACGGSTCVGNE